MLEGRFHSRQKINKITKPTSRTNKRKLPRVSQRTDCCSCERLPASDEKNVACAPVQSPRKKGKPHSNNREKELNRDNSKSSKKSSSKDYTKKNVYQLT